MEAEEKEKTGGVDCKRFLCVCVRMNVQLWKDQESTRVFDSGGIGLKGRHASHFTNLYVTCVSQGDVPWDEKDFRYLLVTAAGLASVLLYFYFRDNGREISWKDFVHNYISRGVVSGTGLVKPIKPVESKPHCHCKCVSVCPSRWNV